MIIPGRIHNGVVVLDGGAALPEGTVVTVSYGTMPQIHAAKVRRPVVLPIFPYDGPPDISLTNDQIAAILDEEDASP